MISKEKISKTLSIIFLIWLLLIFFINFLIKTSLVNYFTNFLSIQYWILILTIVFWSLFFYSSNEKIKKLNLMDDLENEEIKNKWLEFELNFPNINKIPLINIIFKWFYKNGFIYSFIFLLIVFIWGANIFINLWKLPFHQDEKYHFSTAVTYSKTGEFARWDFLYNEPGDPKWADRNKSLTILTSYSQKIFWLSEFSSRLPVAFAGFIWLFFIYFISIKITWNRIIWLISIYIYWVNDIILYFSWFIRAYIFLIVLSLILFFLLYNFLLEKNRIKKLYYSIASIIIFTFWLFELHWTTIVLFPFLGAVLFIWLLQIYSFRKHYIIYLLFFILWLVFILNTIWIIHIFKMPFGIQNQINLVIDFSKPQKIYLSHLTNPFNFGFSLIFLLLILFFINFKKNFYIYLFLVFSIFVPLFFALYFFNRYEDFRYISLIQWIFVIYVSIFIYYLRILVINDLDKEKYFTLIILSIIFIPLQFPYILEIKPFTKTSQADWENIEWSRIHFRLSQPDSFKAFDYIFNNFDDITLLRLPDGGINWDDNYYLSKYIKKYPENKVDFYANNKDNGINFDEVYNSEISDKDLLLADLNFFDILKEKGKIIVIWNTRDLTNRQIMNFLDNDCENIAPKIWIVKYRIFAYLHPVDNYFPNVFVCEIKNKN